MSTITETQTLDPHVRWTVDRLTKDGPRADAEEVEQHLALDELGIPAASMAARMREGQASRGAFVGIEWFEDDGAVVVLAQTVGGHRMRMRFTRCDDGRAVPGYPERVVDTEVDTTVRRTSDVDATTRAGLARCFEATYAGADQSYLDDQLARFDWIAIASRDGVVVGFVPAMQRTLAIDGLGDRRVAMPGLSCVHPSARRNGLFSSLATAVQLACLEGGPFPDLAGAKYATPASAQSLIAHPAAAPRPGLVLTEVHRAAGRAIAAALGCETFDEGTFVCRGPGRPIGQAILDVDATADDWAWFRHVDRARGDTLLGIAWITDPPQGW